MDSNWFDTWLKDRLYRDIIFRIVIWAIIAAVTAFIASRDIGFSGYAYLEKMAKTLFPLLNVIGSSSIILAMFALMFKDAQHVDPTGWGPTSIIGRFGGVVRRLATDSTLWVVGALVAILSAVTVALVQAMTSGAMEGKTAAIIVYAYIAFVAYLFFSAAINVFVRTEGPLLASPRVFGAVLTTTTRVVLVYFFLAGFIVVYVVLTS